MLGKEKQIQFYKEELEELVLEVKANFESPAINLFKSGKLYIAQFKGFDEKRGNVFFDIKNLEEDHTPRVDQQMNCFKLQLSKMLPKQWGNSSYRELLNPLNSDLDMSQIKLVSYIKSEREGWIKMILNGVDYKFVKTLKLNDVLGFGPTIPPFEYLINLKQFSNDLNKVNPWDKILNFDYHYSLNREPKLIDESIDIAGYIIKEVNRFGLIVFQGPPGTGKTYQIADVISRLAKINKSVLVTALTNKATIETCEKPFLKDLLNQQKVSKTSLTSNEILRYPNLKYASEISPAKGEVQLATYYQFSKYWQKSYKSQVSDNLFDYVIVEESSQAFLTTIAAALKVGRKVIVVGDPMQIEPIVKFKNYKKISININLLVNRLQTMCNFEGIPFFRKIESRRLTDRATRYTNLFYEGTIVSKSNINDLSSDINMLNFLGTYIHPKGGPTLILNDFENSKNVICIVPFLVKAINDIILNNKGTIAVLTPFVETAIFLQKTLKTKTQSNNYLIDTIDRVQGLDVDYCFFIIPDKNYSFSFNLNRFNVATSRSKKATFILASKNFYKKAELLNQSGKYLTNLLNDFCFIEDNGIMIKK
ncbi:AAA domain-containing protein [Polaribacter sp. AHE13PA]|uniref:AAA domain-containing protein n=1 Tax=Polaribacter sp. AHE13PA TaxID=2745562 RepID=UPI001C4F3D53|nr:AAA domain-containing protein [Polaribacter sp. AHE13PA]QXP65742.1 AAA family ATPase [Polaribacter sp. AHE13PA]